MEKDVVSLFQSWKGQMVNVPLDIFRAIKSGPEGDNGWNLAAVTEKLKLEHLNRVIADIEVSWEHAILSEVEEEKEEQAWEMMKSYARAWRQWWE